MKTCIKNKQKSQMALFLLDNKNVIIKQIILCACKESVLLHLIALIRDIYVQVQRITFFRIN